MRSADLPLLPAVVVSARASKNRAAWPIGMAPSSTSVLPPTRTARARGLSRRAPAVGAGHAPHVGLELGPGGAAGRLAIAGQQLGGHALPLLGVRPDPPPVLPAVDDQPVAGAVEPDVAEPLVEVAPGALEHRPLGGTVGVGLEVGGDPLEEVPPPLAHLLDRPERRDRAVPDRERRVGDQQVGVEVVADAQAVARQAHPLRAVEAEELRAGRVEAQPAGGAGVVRREQQVGLALGRDDDRPLAQLEGLLDRLGQPRPDARDRP